MKNIEKLRQTLHIRIHGNPDSYFTDSIWADETDAICQDIKASIQFIQKDCTDEELWWLGEVFDDIMDQTHSVEFLNCLRQRAQQVENLQWKADILEDIRTAAEYIDE